MNFFYLYIVYNYITISALNYNGHSNFRIISSKSSYSQRISASKLYCIGTQPFVRGPPGEKGDADPMWQTPPSSIVPVKMEKFKVRPKLITFEAFDTLIEPSQSVGRWFREVLNMECKFQIRLPRPALFTAAYKKAYFDMCLAHPCFGVHSGMSSRDWWFEVISKTYKSTQDLNTILPKEMDQLLPSVAKALYDNVFGAGEGWLLKEDALYTLEKLREWRDLGSGPKLAVVSNFDERLHDILRDMEIYDSFDFVITSHETKFEKPQRELFDIALEKAQLKDAGTAFHVGCSVDKDAVGASRAGWSPMILNEWFDEQFPDWFDIDTAETADEGYERRAALQFWGRRDPEKDVTWVELWGLDEILHLFGLPDDEERPVRTTYIRGFRDD